MASLRRLSELPTRNNTCSAAFMTDTQFWMSRLGGWVCVVRVPGDYAPEQARAVLARAWAGGRAVPLTGPSVPLSDELPVETLT